MRKFAVNVYTVIVDGIIIDDEIVGGKKMTVIDPDLDSEEKFTEGIYKRFGKSRVNEIERKMVASKMF